MFPDLLSIFRIALDLWDNKEKMQYVNHLNQLEVSWNNEWKKPDATRDNSKLDDLDFQLRLASRAFAASVAGQKMGV